ncbi:hypothetical protein Bsp3421_002834 [Burkholderia sp. FERM BP-3421]|uniref:hypothetical protein n=1 Tax=Burkholderia sp. FERM BP-3421 TaxID=1494466 RepID=UPI00235ECDFF|nr:hypothetical protein [Burkholderia sp. FERM BP-3421]WDD92805.1 hypothetical protein Bsp3421_002834 [Burkholderia sp. FERM BP-3421]
MACKEAIEIVTFLVLIRREVRELYLSTLDGRRRDAEQCLLVETRKWRECADPLIGKNAAGRKSVSPSKKRTEPVMMPGHCGFRILSIEMMP